MKEKCTVPLPVVVLLLLSWAPFSLTLPQTIRLGALFDVQSNYEETAFRHVVERVNADDTVLPRSRLFVQMEQLPIGDSFHASKKVCELLKEGTWGIFGPQSPAPSSHVQSVCEALAVPHIETKWDFRSTIGSTFMINLFPHPATLSRAYADVIQAWGWDKYVIIYENEHGLVRLQDILKESHPTARQAIVKKLPSGTPEAPPDYRPLFKELRANASISNIILDCDGSKLANIFEQARAVGMMKDKKYFITSLDIHTLDPEHFKHTDINITALSLVNSKNPKVRSVTEQWARLVIYGLPNHTVDAPYTNPFIESGSRGSSNWYRASRYNEYRNRGEDGTSEKFNIPSLSNDMVTTEMALIYDGVEILARTLHALDKSQMQRLELKPLECRSPPDTWQAGYMIMDALKKVDHQGLSGIVKFDQNGYRSSFQLDVMELSQGGLRQIGVWDSSNYKEKFRWIRTAQETLKQQEQDLKNRTLTVTIKLSAPHTMDWYNNGTIVGYAIDLLDMLAESLEFNYEIFKVADNNYGLPNNETGQWDGMIGEILSGRADIAIADVTINYLRQQVVDFTMPYMNLGISILYKMPEKQNPSLFSFLEPFSPDVWIYMATAYLSVSLILFLLARGAPDEWAEPPPCSKDHGEILENQFNMLNSLWFSTGSLMQQGCDLLPKIAPDEWKNPHPCKDDPDELENDLDLNNALWHNWGSIMQQGSDIAPAACSTRTVAGIWWFFTLIMISSYTANLAAFLAQEGMVKTFDDISDLPKQTKVKYGCLGSGSTASFFKFLYFTAGGTIPQEISFHELNAFLIPEIWNNMKSMRPSPFVSSTKGGVDRVRKSKADYAFFMESPGLEYTIERECSLTQIGGLLDSKGYGIALRKNSKYREAFNSRILELAEQGELEKLKEKWWKNDENPCPKKEKESTGAKALTLKNVGGVFVVLLGGCAVSCVMAFIEFLWKSRKLAASDNESFWAEIAKEFRFAVSCSDDKKAVKKGKSGDNGSSSSSESVQYLAFKGKDANGD